MKRLILTTILVLFALVPAAFGQSAKTELQDPALATRFNEISDKLVCQCSCQMILRVCNHVNCPSAIPMRHEVEKQLLEGKDNEAIIASFVAQYGKVVLSSPPATGFNLAAWVMPGFGLLIGLFIVFTMATRWTSKRKATPAMAGPVDVELKQRIEKELKSE